MNRKYYDVYLVLLSIVCIGACFFGCRTKKSSKGSSSVEVARTIIKELEYPKTVTLSNPKYYLSEKILEQNTLIIMGFSGDETIEVENPGYLLYIDLMSDYDWSHPVAVIVFYPDNIDLPYKIMYTDGPLNKVVDSNGNIIECKWIEL